MILQALKEYYDRKAQDPDSALAPEGWIEKGIDYVVVLTRDGSLANVECLQTQEGKKPRSKPEFVPYIGKQAIKHTNSGKDANLLWDNSTFVFGLGSKGKAKIASFMETIEARHSLDDEGIKAVHFFISKGIEDSSYFDPILKHPQYGEEISSGVPIVTFKLAGDDVPYVFYRPPVKAQYEAGIGGSVPSYQGTCLITGEAGVPIAIKHPSVKNLFGQSKIAPLVSCNEDAYDSYGKKGKQKESDSLDKSKERKGVNAPVSIQAIAAYSKALASLLNSKQKLGIADSTVVFWAEKPDELETAFPGFFGEPPKDDPDRNTKAVESLYRSVEKGTGAFAIDSDNTRFYVIGLSPNAARISVRFWQVGTVAEMAGRVRKYFDEIKIVHGPKESPYLSLFRLLVNTAALGKADNIPPNLAGETMRAILSGQPYPATLLQAAIRRIRAEHEVNYPRASLIKACINRNSGREELTVSLDESNTNQAYRLGRLFAVLERAQARANPRINATIRDRYYSSASAAPSTAFPLLMRLKNHHTSKLENRGEAVNLEKLIGSIADGISSSGFPHHLSLDDQGRFAIGYYHQRQAFFNKKDENANSSDKGE